MVFKAHALVIGGQKDRRAAGRNGRLCVKTMCPVKKVAQTSQHRSNERRQRNSTAAYDGGGQEDASQLGDGDAQRS